MIKYQGYYITTTPDCGENEGGLFCQIYADESMDTEVDNFCVHKGEDAMRTIRKNVDDFIEYSDADRERV